MLVKGPLGAITTSRVDVLYDEFQRFQNILSIKIQHPFLC